MKTLIKVSCVDQTLRLTNTPKIASGGVEEDRLHVDFCPMWDGFGKAAIFYRNPDEAYRMVLDGDGECIIPAVVLTDPGILYFAVYGTKDGVTRTSEVVQYRIVEGALTSAVEAPPDPPANVVDQLLQLVAPITELVAGKAEKVDLNAHMNNRTNPHRVTPEQIGASAVGHVHSPESIGAAPAVHTHTPESIGAAPTAHTHALGDIGAAAASHTHVPEEVGAEPAKLVFYDVVVPVDAWLFNSTYEDYPYRAAVELDGVDSSMIPDVHFDSYDSDSGVFSRTSPAYDGGLFLYATTVPPTDRIIPTIIIWSGASHSSGSADAVTSVNGKTGAVNLTAEDVGARPASWVPTATEVGALPADTELPSTVGLASIEYVNQRTTTMTGASADVEGVSGLVPAPAAGDENKVLSGSGAWIELPTVEGGGTESGVSEDKFVLLNDITLDEAVNSFERNTADDDTPYNLKRVRIRVSFSEIESEYGAVYYSNNLFSNETKLNNVIHKGRIGVIETGERNGKVFHEQWWEQLTGTTSDRGEREKGNPKADESVFADFNPITNIKLRFDAQSIKGTIKIYGVRA